MAAVPASSVRKGTVAARACAGVIFFSQPANVNVSKAPPTIKSRLATRRGSGHDFILEFVSNIDASPPGRLVRLFVATAQGCEIESLYARMRIIQILHIQVD